jgi:propanol-preferring alcohol dehydrogenase
MRAARLHELGKPLRVDDVDVPDVQGDEVLIRIGGAGVCHTDVHIRSGEFPLPPGMELPLTLGHENAGTVEALGPEVVGLTKGDAVAVFGGRGCGRCRICLQGDEQVCNMALWVAGGGYAEFMHIPASRLLIKLEGLDPAEAAPLADAGLTPYRAIKKVLPYLHPGCSVVVIGIGGLGHLALQILKVLSPVSRIIAVDVSDEKLQAAADLGADHVIDGRGDVGAEVLGLTGGEGAQAVIDLVGTDATLRNAAAAAGRKSIIVVVGIGGGTLPYSFFNVRGEAILTNSYWGSFTEFQELLTLGRDGKVRATVERMPLERTNEALDLLEHGKIHGRVVIVP